MKNFKKQYLQQTEPSGRENSVRAPAKIAFATYPKRLVRHLSSTLNISETSLLRILHQDLNFHFNKLQLLQALKDTDFIGRQHFCSILLGKLSEVNGFDNLVIIEANCHLFFS